MTRKRVPSPLTSPLASLRKAFGRRRAASSRAGSRRTRALGLERCEQRTLLAIVGGIVYDDLTGDGFTPDDQPAADVSVELFLDGGDGVFDFYTNPGGTDDTLSNSQTTAPVTGAYEFTGMSDGTCFVAQQVPTGAVQTGGLPYYEFDVVNGVVFSGGHSDVDNFDQPDPDQSYFVENAGYPDPLLHKTQDSGILTGQRDLLIDVLGTPNPISAQATLGQGSFDFATGSTGAGSSAKLQYDGIDADLPGPPASLVRNTSNPGADLTEGGANSGLRFDFDSIQVPGIASSLNVQIELTSPGGGAAIYSGQIPESPTSPTSFFVPFSAFAITSGFAFDDVNVLECTFNQQGVPDVDFGLDLIALDSNSTPFNFANCVLPSVSGRKFQDLTGDGFSPDDVGMPNVDIDLFLDGGDGVFDYDTNPGGTDDTLYDTQTTDGNGDYTFVGLIDGLYFIREVVPAGFIQTGGPAFYTFEVVGATVFSGTDEPVDTFDSPDPEASYFIENLPNFPDPLLLKSTGTDGVDLIGGERDLLIDVLGTANPISAVGSIGEGVFSFGTGAGGPATMATLQYDNLDADIVGPPAMLVNNLGLFHDLTVGGANTGFRFDFDSLQVPSIPAEMDARIRVTGPGGTANVDVAFPASALPQCHFVPFTDFSTTGTFSFTDVTSIEVDLNYDGATAIANVDFTLDAITLNDTETGEFDFANFEGQPGIDIEKSTNTEDADLPTGPILCACAPVTWTYVVTNTGDLPLANVVVTDDAGTPGDTGDDFNPTFVGGDANNNGLLDVGETWIYTDTGNAQAGQYTNLSTVVGTPANNEGEPIPELENVTAEDPSNYFGAEPIIDIEKATNGDDADVVTGPIVLAGSTVTWTYEVTNNGNIAMGNVVVVDDAGTPGDSGDDFSPDPTLAAGFNVGDLNMNNLLDLDETWLYSATAVAQVGQYGNIATVTGDAVDMQGEPLSCGCSATDADPSHYFGADPSIHIEKATNGQDADTPTGPVITVGDAVYWTYVVTNPGNVPLAGIIVVDDAGTPGDTGDDFNPTPSLSGGFNVGDLNTNNLLDPGESWLYSASSVALEGQYANLAEVTGTPSYDTQTPEPVTDDDPSHYCGYLPPSSISGYVYIDSNDNGIFESGEWPIPGTTVTLMGIDDQGDPVQRTAVTDQNGFYLFDWLRPGLYDVLETQPADYVDGRDTIGPQAALAGGQVANDLFWDIQLPQGVDAKYNNFGELGLREPSKRLLLAPSGYWDQIEVNGAGNAQIEDMITLEGTPEDDLLVIKPGYEPGTWLVKLNGVVQGVAPEGTRLHFYGGDGTDHVEILGTEGNDILSFDADTFLLVGPTYAFSGSSVETGNAGGGGGYDAVALHDSPGNDEIIHWPAGALIRGAGLDNVVWGFESVQTLGGAGGSDLVRMFDSPQNDTLTAGNQYMELSGKDYSNKAIGFKNVHAYATSGGYDVAKMFDTPENDIFFGCRTEASLYHDGFLNRAVNFDAVHSYATSGGYDIAQLLDSSGDDVFYATPTEGVLYGEGFLNRGKGFEGVHAYANCGGNDVADLYDSAADDVFFANGVEGTMYRVGEYLSRAKNFEKVRAHSTAGGNDVAQLVDASGNDLLQAAANWAQLTYSNGSITVEDFDAVTGYSQNGGQDKKEIGAVDFLFTAEGMWEDN